MEKTKKCGRCGHSLSDHWPEGPCGHTNPAQRPTGEDCSCAGFVSPPRAKKKPRSPSDWKLYQRIRNECIDDPRNHNIREDLLERAIIRRFAKAVRES